jgi:hypothetical protein
MIAWTRPLGLCGFYRACTVNSASKQDDGSQQNRYLSLYAPIYRIYLSPDDALRVDQPFGKPQAYQIGWIQLLATLTDLVVSVDNKGSKDDKAPKQERDNDVR